MPTIIEEEKNNIEFLTKQYKRCIYVLKEKEKKVNLRNKISPLFFITFICTWGALAISSYYIFHNSLLGNIITLILLGANIYVYIIFINAFLEEANNEYKNAQDSLNNIKNELDTYLQKNNYNIDKFYRNI